MQIFCPILRAVFWLVYGFPCCVKAFKFNYVSFVYLCFYLHYSTWWIKKKILLKLILKSILLMFSTNNFTVCSFTFMSLIHFEFIFVLCIRKYSKLNLYINFPVFPTPIIEETLFSPLYSCLLYQR